MGWGDHRENETAHTHTRTHTYKKKGKLQKREERKQEQPREKRKQQQNSKGNEAREVKRWEERRGEERRGRGQNKKRAVGGKHTTKRALLICYSSSSPVDDADNDERKRVRVTHARKPKEGGRERGREGGYMYVQFELPDEGGEKGEKIVVVVKSD